MFSDNENLKKFVEPSKEEKRKVMSGRWTRKMMANSFYGAYVPDYSCVVNITNGTVGHQSKL